MRAPPWPRSLRASAARAGRPARGGGSGPDYEAGEEHDRKHDQAEPEEVNESADPEGDDDRENGDQQESHVRTTTPRTTA